MIQICEFSIFQASMMKAFFVELSVDGALWKIRFKDENSRHKPFQMFAADKETKLALKQLMQI